MKNWFIGRILGFIAGKLDGYKSKIGGIGMILLGIAGLIREMYPDLTTLPEATLETSLTLIVSGFGILGIGGKLDKQKEAVTQSAQSRDVLLSEQNAILAKQNELIEKPCAGVDKVTEQKG